MQNCSRIFLNTSHFVWFEGPDYEKILTMQPSRQLYCQVPDLCEIFYELESVTKRFKKCQNLDKNCPTTNVLRIFINKTDSKSLKNCQNLEKIAYTWLL